METMHGLTIAFGNKGGVEQTSDALWPYWVRLMYRKHPVGFKSTSSLISLILHMQTKPHWQCDANHFHLWPTARLPACSTKWTPLNWGCVPGVMQFSYTSSLQTRSVWSHSNWWVSSPPLELVRSLRLPRRFQHIQNDQKALLTIWNLLCMTHQSHKSEVWIILWICMAKEWIKRQNNNNNDNHICVAFF